MKKPDTYHLIEERIEHLGQWLVDSAPYVEFDQMHLESGTPEQAYWHLGYRAALADMLVLMKADEAGRLDALIVTDEESSES
jgi:hypothetical protein